MSYKRKHYELPDIEPVLFSQYKHTKLLSPFADAFSYHQTRELMEDGHFALRQIESTLEHIKQTNYDDLKESVAVRKKQELVYASRKALMTFLRKHVDRAREDVEKTRNKILRVTEIDHTGLSTAQLIEKLSLEKEIRDEIRKVAPKDRSDFIKGNLEFLKAVAGSPTPLLNHNTLTTLRMEAAMAADPSLQDELKDSELTYQIVRKRAAEVSAVSVKLLLDTGINDPVPPAEHFDVFPPQSDHEREIANRMIQAYDNKKDQAERKARFDEQNPGINLQAERKPPSTTKARIRQ